MMDVRLLSPPEALASAFRSLTSIGGIATLLNVRPDQVHRYVYGRGYRYRSFTVKKRRGGIRTIREPHPGLKAIQQKLAQVLVAVYEPLDCVHGFVEGRSIATNAQQHIGSDWVFNADLKDFFPSINFGRVQGILIRRYGIPHNIASVLARICTYEDTLPQGAPTSPVVSNMVAQRLDRHLSRLARRKRCQYTRFADDITFSRSGEFPEAIGYWDRAAPPRESLAGDRLKRIVEDDNGFTINTGKVRLAFRDERQIVTGLVVNEKVNVRRTFIRRIRAMLHSWETHGERKAEETFFNHYDTKDRAPHAVLRFRCVVKGHIDFVGMVRGTNDRWYQTFITKYADLVRDFVPRPDKYRRPNHLRTWKDAVWIIESDDAQGTAFELEGYGLVTCAHVVRNLRSRDEPARTNLHVYSPRNDELRYPVRILAYDRDLDIAILEVDASADIVLKPKFEPSPGVGDVIKAVGYPRHSPGAKMWEESGCVTHVRKHMSTPRYMVNVQIHAGASGSPILDGRGRVIGVAAVGAESFGAAPESGYGIIPITAVRTVWESKAPTSAKIAVPASS